MIEGKRVPFLKKSFVKNIQCVDEQDAVLFLQPLIDCLLHGETPRHDQKIERAATYHVKHPDIR